MARNSELLDRFQIAIEQGDGDALVSLFAPDGFYVAFGRRHEGRDGIRR